MARIWSEGPSYGRTGYGNGKRVLIDRAPILQALNVGTPGGCGRRLPCFSHEDGGYEVHREFYINDAGNQVAGLAASLEARSAGKG